jgi:S-adenosylmethionine decarboxylase proenzyme
LLIQSLSAKEYAGTQAIIDLYSCSTEYLDDIRWIEKKMIRAATLAGGSIVRSEFHQFSPWGISGVVIIAESHIAIHTWPEYRFAAIDIFTCSEDLKLQKAYDYLIDAFRTGEYEITTFKRGTRLLNQNHDGLHSDAR